MYMDGTPQLSFSDHGDKSLSFPASLQVDREAVQFFAWCQPARCGRSEGS